jgi:hypothetical protein
MTRSHLVAIATLLAAGVVAGTSLAQQPAPQPQRPGGPPATGQQGPGYPAPGPLTQLSEQGEGPPAPVIMVTSVEVLRSPHAGGMDIIRARGLTSSNAWTSPHLIPITRGEPIDGVLDLLFEANAPSGPVAIGPFMPIEAILPIENGHPYKGVRIRAGTNALGLKELPGFAEVPGPKNDCSKCLGKYFVAKGASPPSGVADDKLVREADLPWTLRVSYVSDPNRLTLVLSEDGRIVDAGWD